MGSMQCNLVVKEGNLSASKGFTGAKPCWWVWEGVCFVWELCTCLSLQGSRRPACSGCYFKLHSWVTVSEYICPSSFWAISRTFCQNRLLACSLGLLKDKQGSQALSWGLNEPSFTGWTMCLLLAAVGLTASLKL